MKKAYKYAVRRVKQRQVYISNEKLGSSLCSANFIKFWQQVRAMKSSPSSVSPIVDGFSCESTITDNV